jgi:hypothetical protein
VSASQANPDLPKWAANVVSEALIRTTISLVMDVIGFWFPWWWDSRYGGPDSRTGFFFLWSLPVIAYYAARATMSLVHAYHYAPASRLLFRWPLAAGLVLLCWAPIAFVVVAG